jgi:hypothetical protein
MGIEPTAQAWEAWVLPLYDARARVILGAFHAIRQPPGNPLSQTLSVTQLPVSSMLICIHKEHTWTDGSL